MECSFNDLHRRVSSCFSSLQKQAGVRDDIVSRIAKKNEQLKTAERDSALAKTASSFVDSSVKNVRLEVLTDLETIVNSALQSVYEPDSPSVELELSNKRDRTAITPYFIQQVSGKELRRRYEGLGCGVSDIVSVALRLVLIKASGADSVLVADEPFRFLGTAQVPRASMLLKEIAQRLGVQVILTTHHDTTVDVADRAFLLQKTDDGVSVHTKE